MSDLWRLCKHGEAKAHGVQPKFPSPTLPFVACPGGHPVEGGVALKWCDVHDAQQTAIEPLPEGIRGACWKKHTFAKYLSTDCRMVERFLISELGVDRVGGEKVWWCEVHNTQAANAQAWDCFAEGYGACRMVERFLIPLPNTVDHPTVLDFWRHEPPKSYSCWVCGVVTDWIYLDIGHQHPDCEMYPTEEGDVVVVGGVQVSGPLIPLCETCSGLAVRTGNDPYAVCQKCNGTGLAPKPEREKSNE